MERMDLNLLVALDRLLEHQSVTLAAKDLGLSQPAMSRTLGRLRDTLGDPLFVRSGRSLVPTPRAQALAGPLREALQAARRVVEPPPRFEPVSATGELRLALTDELQLAFADRLVGAVRAAAPGVDVRLLPLAIQSLDAARRGTLDLALSPDLRPLPASAGGDVDTTELVHRRLYTRRFVVVHAAARDPVVGLDGFCAAHHVIVSGEGAGRAFLDEYLATLGRRRRVAATVTTFTAAARLVARSDLVVTMPEEVAQAHDEPLRWAPPPLPVPALEMHLMWHPSRTAQARHRFFRELVARVVLEGVRGSREPV